jgi:prevent-host-death family protein
MRIVDIHEAKTNLSELVEQAVSHSEPFVIAQAGKPLVKVAPIESVDLPRRRIGFLRGRYAAPDDIDATGRDAIEAMFESEE